MPVAVLRADGNTRMGMGHLMRQFALGEALMSAGMEVIFLYGEAPAGFAGKLAIAGFGLAKCAFRTGTSIDAENLFAIVQGKKCDVIVVDGYHFNDEYHRYLAQMGKPVICFDDMCHLQEYCARIIVNSSPNFAELPYASHAPQATVLGGPKYALLRKEIVSAMSLPRVSVENRNHVLVNFGGADPLHLSEPVAGYLDEHLPKDIIIDLVTGPAHADISGVVQLTAASETGRLNHFHKADNMGELMNRAGLAVTGGGGTVAELALLQVPSLLTIIADNQVAAAENSWCATIDARKDKPSDAAEIIARKAVDLWHNADGRRIISEKAEGLVDGQGGARVAAEIQKLAREAHGVSFNPMGR